MGIWSVPSLSSYPNVLIVSAVFIAILIVLYLQLAFREKRKPAILLLPFFALVIGYCHGYLHFQLPKSPHHIYNIATEKSEVIISGHLREMVSYDGRISRAVINIETVRKKDDPLHKEAHGKARLSYAGTWPEEILPGDHIIVRATIVRPRSYYTIGAFDYEQYLAQKDIWVTGFIRSPLFIKELTDSQNILQRLSYLPERIRSQLGAYLDRSLPEEYSSIFRALLLGDRSNVSPAILELFKATGTFHILAISGLHIAVIATFLYLLIYWLFSRSEWLLLQFNVRKIVAVITVPLLLLYALLAGMNSPVTRAVLMGIIVIVALCTERKKSPAPLVAAAALIILMVDPLQLFTVSFQLSFAATIGILFLLPHLLRIFEIAPKNSRHPFMLKAKLYIISAVLVSVVATLATAPIALGAFNRISTIGPLANLVLEPLICLWCLPFGVLSLPFMYLYPPAADLALAIGSYGIKLALFLAEILADIPFSSLFLPSPSQPFLIAYFLLLCDFLSGLLLRHKIVALLASIIFILTISLSLIEWPSGLAHDIRISFLNVGQGSATVISDGNRTIIIDGGGSSFSSRTVGETVIAPYLWNRGIRHVDSIVITHPDADHYNGLPYIVKHFAPAIIWVKDLEDHNDNYAKFIAEAKKLGVKVNVPKVQEKIVTDHFELECLANLSKSAPQSINDNRKNSGLVLRLCVGETCFLFPGDIYSSMEQQIVDHRVDLKANFLLAAHHGSATSNSRIFLEAVKPQYTVVSAGSSGRGYFPSKNFLDLTKELNIKVLRTSVDGTIEMSINGNVTQIETTVKHGNNPLYPMRKQGMILE